MMVLLPVLPDLNEIHSPLMIPLMYDDMKVDKHTEAYTCSGWANASSAHVDELWQPGPEWLAAHHALHSSCTGPPRSRTAGARQHSDAPPRSTARRLGCSSSRYRMTSWTIREEEQLKTTKRACICVAVPIGVRRRRRVFFVLTNRCDGWNGKRRGRRPSTQRHGRRLGGRRAHARSRYGRIAWTDLGLCGRNSSYTDAAQLGQSPAAHALGQCFLACGNVLASVCILLWACCTVSCVHKYIPNTRDAPKPQQACDKGETRPETGGTEHVQANSPRIRDQPANNSLLEADEAPKSRVRRMSGFTLNIAALDGSAARSKTPTAPTPAKGNTIRRSLSNAAHLASPRRITRSLSACCVAKVPAASGKERRRSLLTGSPRMQLVAGSQSKPVIQLAGLALNSLAPAAFYRALHGMCAEAEYCSFLNADAYLRPSPTSTPVRA
eukprot:5485351-Pleurochrysis_carterae.AAC.2